MNVSTMTGRVLNWLTAAALTEMKADPKDWNPVEKMDDLKAFWSRPGAGCYRTKSTVAPVAGCAGRGEYEAVMQHHVARGNTPNEAICRVLIVAAFGVNVDVPKEFQP